MEIWAQIATAGSPILAVILAYLLNMWSEIRVKNQLIETEIRKEKMEILKTLMSGRVAPDWRYFQSLNIIEIIFADNKDVRAAWKELFQLYSSQNTDQNDFSAKIEMKQIKLIESISDDLGYKGKINWETISEKYSPIYIGNQMRAQNAYYNVFIRLSDLLDGQNTTPMVTALNNIAGSINNIIAFLHSVSNPQQNQANEQAVEETKPNV